MSPGRAGSSLPWNRLFAEFTVIVAGVLTDPDVISALQIQAMASHIRRFNLGRLEEPTTRLIRLLRAELP